MVEVAYSIGIAEPLSVFIDSYGTVCEGKTDDDLCKIVKDNFDMRAGKIIQELKLTRPIFKKTTAGCHFGRNDPDFTWETPKQLKY